VEDARKISDAANTQAALAADRVERAGKGAKEARDEMQKLIDTALKLRQQKAAKENDLLELYNRLVGQEQRVRVLVADISSAELALTSERTMRSQVSSKLSQIEALVRAKDAETNQLRDQLSYASDVAEAQKQMAQHNASLVGKESQRADRLAGESTLKTKLLIGTGGLLLLACVLIILLVRSKLPL
jgi:hypothetical protein